jgi:hypothetical protein
MNPMRIAILVRAMLGVALAPACFLKEGLRASARSGLHGGWTAFVLGRGSPQCFNRSMAVLATRASDPWGRICR